MKKPLIILALIIVNFSYASQDTVWRRGGLISLNFTQVSLSNWGAGGQNSISGNTIINYFANYRKGKNAWDSNLDLGYGFIREGKEGKLIKSDDKIDFSTKVGHEASKKWYYSALINFRSQFAPGYNYPNDSMPISDFFAPAYLIVSIGMDYKPNNNFSLFLSPATGRFIFLNDKRLSDIGAFGVDSGKTLRIEAGAYLKATLKKDLNSAISIQSSIDLFSNYLDKPQNIDINWQAMISMKLSKLFSACLSTQFLYDDNTKLAFYKNDSVTIDHFGPGIQFKEVFGIGLAYRFSSVSIRP